MCDRRVEAEKVKNKQRAAEAKDEILRFRKLLLDRDEDESDMLLDAEQDILGMQAICSDSDAEIRQILQEKLDTINELKVCQAKFQEELEKDINHRLREIENNY